MATALLTWSRGPTTTAWRSGWFCPSNPAWIPSRSHATRRSSLLPTTIKSGRAGTTRKVPPGLKADSSARRNGVTCPTSFPGLIPISNTACRFWSRHRRPMSPSPSPTCSTGPAFGSRPRPARSSRWRRNSPRRFRRGPGSTARRRRMGRRWARRLRRPEKFRKAWWSRRLRTIHPGGHSSLAGGLPI